VKLSNNGNLEYEAVKGGVDWDFALDVIEPTPGKFVIAGETSSAGNGASDGWIFQFDDASRTFDWENTIGTPESEKFTAIVSGYNNDYFATGSSKLNNSVDSDILLGRISQNGDSLFTKLYGDTLVDFGNDLAFLSDSTIAITGGRQLPGMDPGVAVLKVDSIGTIFFDTLWGNSNADQIVGNRIIPLPNLRYAVIGTTTLYPGNNDVFLAYTYPGNEFPEIATTQGSLQDDWGQAAVILGTNGYAVAGHSIGYNSVFRNIVVYRTDEKFKLVPPKVFKHNEDTQNITSIESKSAFSSSFHYDSNENTLRWESPNLVQLTIYDLSGRRLFASSSSSPFYMNELTITSGMYILHIHDVVSGENVILKVIR
jgi:hypothetical protein